MKKRILSLVLCAALLLSLCLFMGAGVPLLSNFISLESYKHGITGCTSPQSVHQRGMTSTAVIPPVHVICVFPSGSSGKSSERMVSLQKPEAL